MLYFLVSICSFLIGYACSVFYSNKYRDSYNTALEKENESRQKKVLLLEHIQRERRKRKLRLATKRSKKTCTKETCDKSCKKKQKKKLYKELRPLAKKSES